MMSGLNDSADITTVGVVGLLISFGAFFLLVVFGVLSIIYGHTNHGVLRTVVICGLVSTIPLFSIGMFMLGHPPGSGPK